MRGELRNWIPGIILVAAACLYFLAYNPGAFGYYHDDSIYVTTAKALATGHGYRIISLPDEPAESKYPPLLPFLLSLIWRFWPNFPANVNAMIALSAAATLSFLALTRRYLVNEKYAEDWQALLVIAAAGLNWRTLIYATGVYSETIYAALSVVALMMAEKLEHGRGWLFKLALGATMGLACLSRISGVPLLIAVAAYFMLRRKLRAAVLPLLAGALFVIGWIGWSYANRTTLTGVNMAWYTNYFGFLREVFSAQQAHSESPMAMVLLGMLWHNALLIGISIPVICLALDYG